MILISLGTHKLNFNRLLEEVDRLIAEGIIKDDVIAQVGYSNYKAKKFKEIDFMEFDKFEELINKSSFIITHGGAGIITKCVKYGKKVIAVPRLKKYGEHVDDHQLEIIGQFANNNQIIGLAEVAELERAILNLDEFTPEPFVEGNLGIINLLENFVAKNFA